MPPVTKNLGTIQAMFVSATAPTNTNQIWYKTGDNLHYYYDTVTLTWTLLKQAVTTKVFANAAARAASTPDFDGQLGVQIDDNSVWSADSTTTGDWVVISEGVLWEIGSGVDSLQTKGNGADASGVASKAIGKNAIANIDSTTVISGAIIIKKASEVVGSDYVLEGAGVLTTLATQEIDLKTVAEYTITIPTGAKFFVDTIDLIITSASAVTVQPTIHAGTGGGPSSSGLIAAVSTIGLIAQFNRERFDVAVSSGFSTLSVGVTVGATATTMKGRFIFKGILIESE